jgi:hypothetical protein
MSEKRSKGLDVARFEAAEQGQDLVAFYGHSGPGLSASMGPLGEAAEPFMRNGPEAGSATTL